MKYDGNEQQFNVYTPDSRQEFRLHVQAAWVGGELALVWRAETPEVKDPEGDGHPPVPLLNGIVVLKNGTNVIDVEISALEEKRRKEAESLEVLGTMIRRGPARLKETLPEVLDALKRINNFVDEDEEEPEEKKEWFVRRFFRYMIERLGGGR